MKKNTSLRVIFVMALAVLMAVAALTVCTAAQEAVEAETQNGFVTVDGVLYYYEGGEPVTGWFQVDGVQYYASIVTGKVIKEDHKIGGKLYLWDETTGLAAANGFVETEGGTVCYLDGKQVTGWRHADGTGAAVDENGVSEEFSANPNGLYYFLYSSGYMVTDTAYTLAGFQREFNEDHTVKPLNGLQNHYGEYYYYENGVIKTGYQTVGGNTYYFRSDVKGYGRAAAQWLYLGNKLYYFYASTSATPYALKTEGTIGGYGYTYGEDGQILFTGFLNADAANQNHNNSSVYVNKMDGTTKYLVDGVPQYGWQYIGTTWYYFDGDSGNMCVEPRTIDGVEYEFSNTGACTSRTDAPISVTLYNLADGTSKTVNLTANTSLFDSIAAYAKDANGQLLFKNWYFDVDGDGVIGADDFALTDDSTVTEEFNGVSLIATWAPAYAGTYYGCEIWGLSSVGGSAYNMTIAEDGTITSNISKISGAKVTSYNPATKEVFWEKGTNKGVFFFDAENGIVGGIYSAYMGTDLYVMTTVNTSGNYKPSAYTSLYAYPVMSSGSSMGLYVKLVTINTKNGEMNVMFYDNAIYANVEITTAAGKAVTITELKEEKTAVIRDTEGKVIFVTGTSSESFGTGYKTSTVVELDQYYGIYTDGEHTLGLDGIGGFIYDGVAGTYTVNENGGYLFDAYTDGNTAYYHFTVDTAAKTFTAVKPTVKITFESDYGTVPAEVDANLNVPFALDTTLTDASHFFRGWYVKGDESMTLVSNDYVPTAAVTLVAKWDTKYTFTINFNGGGEDRVEEHGEGDLLSVENAKKNGSRFLGWYTTPDFQDGTEFVTDTVRISSNVTIYAKFGPAPAYAKTYLPINFYGREANGDVRTGTPNPSNIFTIDPDGIGSIETGKSWMYPFAYGLKVVYHDSVTNEIVILSENESSHRYTYMVMDPVTGILLLDRSYASSVDAAIAKGFSNDVFLMVPLDGEYDASAFTTAGSYWNSGLTRAMSYTLAGNTYNVFVDDSKVYFNVTFTGMDSNALTADTCLGATTLYVHAADGSVVAQYGYNGTTMVALDGKQGTYTGDASLTLNGISTVTFGDFTGTYTAAAEGAGYGYDVYMDENGTTVYYQLTIDADAKTYVMTKPMVNLTFITEHGTAPATTSVNINVATLLPTLTDDAYILRGWYVQGDETMTLVPMNYVATESVTLVAKWDAKATLTVVIGNGYENLVLSYGVGDTVSLTKPASANGLSFNYWSTDAEGANRYTPGTITGNMTIYAQWMESVPYAGSYIGGNLYGQSGFGSGSLGGTKLTVDAEGNTSGNRTGKIAEAENGALSFTYGSASETYAYFDSESGILIYNYSAVITGMKADFYFMVRVEDGETLRFTKENDMSVWNSGMSRLVRFTVGDRTVVAFVANDKVVTVGSIEGVDDLTAVGKMTSLSSGAAIYDTNGNVIGHVGQ